MKSITIDGKRFWLFDDGTTLPVVSGGSDVGPTDPDPLAFDAGAGDGLPPGAVLTVPVPPVAPVEPTNGGPHMWTEAEVNAERERIRKEERDKLYGRIENQDSRLKEIEKERQERIKAEADARKLAEADAETQRREALTASELLAEERARMEDQRKQWEERDAIRDAMLAQEIRLRELDAYRTARIAENADRIEPNLIDYISGGTEEAIDNSIALAVEKTDRIVEAAQGVAQQQRQQQRGPSVTGAPPIGPMDNNPTHENLTAAQIAAMDPETYSQNRDRLMQAVSTQVRQRGYGG